MKNEGEITDIPLAERINRGEITRQELQVRARIVWQTKKDNHPISINGEIGCPVCFSKLSKENRIVFENGYVVCDYCVNYVEGYL